MPNGKPAGVRCVQLTADNLCRLYGHRDRPAVCVNLRPSDEMCGSNSDEALAHLAELERATRPGLGLTQAGRMAQATDDGLRF